MSSASHRTHPGRRRKIERTSYAHALKLITEEGYRLAGSELISPTKPVRQVTRYLTSDPGGCAEFHVVAATAHRLRVMLTKCKICRLSVHQGCECADGRHGGGEK